MAVNLINMLQGEFSDDVVGRIASFVGESPANTKSALGNAGPAILGMLAQRSQTPEGAADVFGMLQRGGFDGASVSSFVRPGSGVLVETLKAGSALLPTLFGGRRSSVTDWVASSSGVSTQSAGSLLGVIAPLVLGLVGREAGAAGGFNMSSVTKLLGDQLPFLRNLSLPGLSGLFGPSGVEEAPRAYQARAEPARAYSEPAKIQLPRTYERSGGLGWLKWAIPLILLALGIWAVTGLRHREPGSDLTTAEGPSAVGTAGSVALVPRRTACGDELQVAPNGVESKLIDYIGDKGQSVDKETWFTFDRLEFESGSASLKPSSQAQLQNIAAILRCYPGVHLKIGGYTDNTGDAASNQRLSQTRAENTRQAIVTQNINGSRLEAEGYGADHPVANNDTEQGRQQNRRIDVRVTEK
jgi:outer membrane protein OmpA-like peptidoglycan-associated protein